MKHQWWKHLKWHLEGLAWCMQGIEWDIVKLPMNITLYGGHLLGDVSSVPQLCHHPTVSGHPGATRVNPSPKSRLPATWLGACLHCIKHFKQRVRVSKSNMTEYEFKYSRYSPRRYNCDQHFSSEPVQFWDLHWFTSTPKATNNFHKFCSHTVALSQIA